MDYQFKDIEQKWQQFWAENQTFKADNQSSKPKYYVMDMFPYPSGAGLHVGHPLGYIASDIFARYKRLKGFNVLHPMGYDSFGLPAEQYAIQTGQHPALTTEANIATYRRQLDQIGFSFDWSREVRTSSPDFYKWTQWIFMQLFNSWYNKAADKAESIDKLVEHFEKHGSKGIDAVYDEEVSTFSADEWKAYSDHDQLAELLKYRLTYLRESTVNWCPALGTVLANDEVKDGFSERGGFPVEQKKMMQWSMRITAYAERLLQGLDTIDWPEPLKEMQRNWIGKSTGALVRFSLAPTLSKGEGEILKTALYDEDGRSLTPTFSKGEGGEAEFNGGKTSYYGYETADPALWKILSQNSKSNRQHPTEAENVLWQMLRNNKTGYKIRREHAIDGYIADFVCLSKGLVIEVDGGYHKLTKEQDDLRTSVLKDKGFDVIRFTNDEVLVKTDDVLKMIKAKLDAQPKREIASPQPSPKERRVETSGSGSLSFGEGRGEAIEVFTTRVDTIFGVTFIVLAPEHELVASLTTPEQQPAIDAYIAQTKKKSELDRMADAKVVSGAFTGSYVVNPLNGEKVPVWIADYVLAGYGTGAVMAVPSGDQRDYLFAKQYGLPIVPIMDIQNIEKEADPTKEGRYINSDFINGLTYKEATAAVIAKLEEIGAGKARINYRMRDAIFGRQRYWGEPVPVYFKDGLPYLIDESDLPLILPEIDKYLPTESGEPPLGRAEGWSYKASTQPSSKERGLLVASPQPSPKEREPLTDVSNSLSFGEGRGEAFPYELSTMPGWAGSSWYWYRYMDVHNDEAFASPEAIEYWKDVDLYIGGSEHATGHLLYSRFWNKFLKDMGLVVEEEPFKKLINQGMIQGRSNFVYRVIDEEGRGTNTFVSNGLKTQYQTNELHVDVNIVNNDILDLEKFRNWRPEYQDAVFILEDGSISSPTGEGQQGTYVCGVEVEKMSKSKFNVVNPDDIIARYGADTLRMYEMFLGPLEQSKPWNTNGIEGVFKFLRKFWRLFHNDQWEFSVANAAPSKAELKSLHKIIRKVEEDVERFSFNTSVSSFMIAVNELTDLKCNKRSILQDMVIILSPYAPHICEELWTLLGNPAGSLSYAPYPIFNPTYLVEDEFAYPVSVNGKTRLNLNLSLSLEPKAIEESVLANADVQKYLDGKKPKKVIVVKGRIVNIVI
jgi:leucyl-tRNA synthetase